MKLSVLIPYRPDTVHRARAFNATKQAWRTAVEARPDIEVIYEDDGAKKGEPFSYARAINRARAKATGDWLLSYSVDALPPTKGILALLDVAIKSGVPWIAPFRGQARFSSDQTTQILQGTPSRSLGNPAGGICIGREAVVAVARGVWDYMGGYDGRFVGWGPEDKAWHLALKAIYPYGLDEPTDEYFRTLFHPPVPRTALPANMFLFQEYQKQATDPVEFSKWYFATRHNSTISTQ